MRQTTKSPGEKIVKDIKHATRKHYSSEEKIRIVLDGLRGEDSIAELCRPLPGRVVQSMIPRGVTAPPCAFPRLHRRWASWRAWNDGSAHCQIAPCIGRFPSAGQTSFIVNIWRAKR
jgi:hypothetical protein